jgi:hypothetical protein
MIAVEEVTIKTINFELDASVLYDIQFTGMGLLFNHRFLSARTDIPKWAAKLPEAVPFNSRPEPQAS